jgi:hypothetical protein
MEKIIKVVNFEMFMYLNKIYTPFMHNFSRFTTFILIIYPYET